MVGNFFSRKLNSYATYLMLGGIFALCFEPFTIPFLSLIVTGVFFILNDFNFKRKKDLLKVFFNNGVFFGFGFFLASTYWISNAILEFNSNLSFLVPLSLIALPLALSLFFGFMQLFNALLWSESNSKLFFFTSNWIVFELIRSYLFSGLPWNLYAYSWSWSLEFIQLVSILGVYGFAFIVLFSSVCMISFLKDWNNYFYFIMSITILIGIYIFGYFRVSNYEVNYSNNEIRIVHTHFDQSKKWLKESIDKTASMGSLEILTIFPETSLGVNFNGPENWFAGHIKQIKDNYYNSIVFDERNYDKRILVPFGEFVPFSSYLLYFFPNVEIFQNSISRGDIEQDFKSDILPLICYEVIFPSYVRNNVREETNLIINISNDAWFGQFSGPKQHFVHAKFRSLELGLPIARSSNKGFSGLIGPIGDVIALINTKDVSYLDLKVPQKLNATIYQRFGNILTYFLIVLFFIIGYAKELKFKNKNE